MPKGKKKNTRHPSPGGDQKTVLIQLGDDADLFTTPLGMTFATVSIGGSERTVPVLSGEFDFWLQDAYRAAFGTLPSGGAVKEVASFLDQRTKLTTAPRDVFTRFAEYRGELFVDLADAQGSIIHITKTGWRRRTQSPVQFVRYEGMRALPVPVGSGKGSWEPLKQLLRLESENDLLLCFAWLLGCLRASSPCPALVLYGEQGSGKSIRSRLLRDVLDPHAVPLRTPPRDIRDVMISAARSGIYALDNVSYLSPILSDEICRVITGAGSGSRTLYTNSDETLLSVRRPVLMNGITEFVTRGDLIDRSIVIKVPFLSDVKTERQIDTEFEEGHARILAALFDTASSALRANGTVDVDLPRMADFTAWVTNAESALGLQPRRLFDAYRANQEAAVAGTIEDVQFRAELERLAAQCWTGTATDLMKTLRSMRAEGVPGTGRAMRSALDRAAPQLRRIGIDIEFGKKAATVNRDRLITLRKSAGYGASLKVA